MLEALANLWYIALVLLGFGFVIFWHELGHFLAARWAKIRVLEFAVGFGPAVLAYRKGIGLRRGSTNPEYAEMLKKHRYEAGEDMGTVVTEDGRLNLDKVPGVSQTEYRLNWVPLGGYVRMLGQEDANPGATSNAIDSYTSVPVWKRLIVISAGVIMNVILAAVIFIGVYSVGLESNAPAIQVPESSRAYDAGLRTGDVVRSVNDHRIEVFQDLLLQIGLSKKGAALVVDVERPGVGPMEFSVEPAYDDDAEIRAIGVYAMPSTTVLTPSESTRALLVERLASFGLDGVEPGMRLVEVNCEPLTPADVGAWGDVALPTALLRASASSDGASVPVVFESSTGERIERAFLPRRVPDVVAINDPDRDAAWTIEHALGLVPVMTAENPAEDASKAGLRDGDIFVRLGEVAWPSIPDGVAAIRAKTDTTIDATVLRDGAMIDLTLTVDAEGLVGFNPGGDFAQPFVTPLDTEGLATDRLSGALSRGTRLVALNGAPVDSIFDVRDMIAQMDADERTVTLDVITVDPGSLTEGKASTLTWDLTQDDVIKARTEEWTGEHMLALFAPATVLQVGSDPVHSVHLGLRETQRMLTRVYLTLGRLADGSVKPQQLKGPVGITHIGSRVAREGWIRLFFFIGLISANLAVLNFLPLPIVDGGHFLMLCYEGITKKPVPIVVQNALTIIGLVLIASVFLFVTTNDVLNLF